MACPRCRNFLATQVVGGMCHMRCISCEYGTVEKGLMVHATRLGRIPTAMLSASQPPEAAEGDEAQAKQAKPAKRAKPTESGDDEQQGRMRDLSYDETLYIIADKRCPDCNEPLRVWLDQKTHLYTYLCSRCHRAVPRP